jgi:membrane-bound lytic murein transglycosylase B
VATAAAGSTGEPVSAPASTTPRPAPDRTPRPAPSATPTSEATAVAVADLVDAEWLARTSQASEVPATALAAYAGAALRTAEEQPGCHLGWNTLAAIGEVESAHGTAGGSALDVAGIASPPILGLPLNGSGGRAAIADSDGGSLDGDTRWDRAVGPMQFIPQSWATWAADGDGDGVSDPQNLHDAALAAARYLCASGDLADPDTWIAAIAAYNDDLAYNNAVADAADRYAGLG